LLVLAGLALAALQARIDSEWATRRSQAANLIVMVGERSGCQGAGIVVGYDDARLYVVTAHHVIRDIPDDQLEISVSLTDSRTGAPGPRKQISASRAQSSPNKDLDVITAGDAEVLEAIRLRTKFDVAGDA